VNHRFPKLAPGDQVGADLLTPSSQLFPSESTLLFPTSNNRPNVFVHALNDDFTEASIQRATREKSQKVNESRASKTDMRPELKAVRQETLVIRGSNGSAMLACFRSFLSMEGGPVLPQGVYGDSQDLTVRRRQRTLRSVCGRGV
jgi:hypothetical protein